MSVDCLQRRQTSGSRRGPHSIVLPASTSISLTESRSFCWKNYKEFEYRSKNSLITQKTPYFFCKGTYSKSMGTKSETYANCIRRTSSLDAICLKGQWPRDAFYRHSSIFKINKATQTDISSNDKTINYVKSNNEEDKLEILIRQCLQKVNLNSQSTSILGTRLISTSNKSDICLTELHSPITFCNEIRSVPGSPSKGVPVSISLRLSLNKPTMGSSSEGLNQEMEKLGLQELDDRYCHWNVPDGRRAPLPDLLRQTRSVNTQTPGGSDEGEDFSKSNLFYRDSFSPIVCSKNEISTPSHING